MSCNSALTLFPRDSISSCSGSSGPRILSLTSKCQSCFTGAFHWLAIKGVSTPALWVNLCKDRTWGYTPIYQYKGCYKCHKWDGKGVELPGPLEDHHIPVTVNVQVLKNSCPSDEAWGAALGRDGRSVWSSISGLGWNTARPGQIPLGLWDRILLSRLWGSSALEGIGLWLSDNMANPRPRASMTWVRDVLSL